MKCPKCGRENVDGAPFCADCGKNLFPVRTPAEAEAPAAEAEASAAEVKTPAAEVVIEALTETVTPAPAKASAAPAASSEEARPKAEGDAVPTPIISDGAIHIGPMTDPEPEPEPVPDPEPASAFVQAFGVSAEPEAALEAAPEAEPAAEAPAEAEAAPEAELAAEPAPEPEAAAATEPAATSEPEPETAPGSEPPAPAGAPHGSVPAPPPAPAPATAPSAPAPAAPESEPEAAAEPEAVAAPGSEAAPQNAPAEEAAPEPDARFAPFADAPIVPPNPARAHQVHPQPGGEALYRKGCLAAAWDDIVQTKGWFGKILLLGLVSCVPILNFFVTGYAMRWSRQLLLGRVEPMPQQIFGNRMFVNGFFAFVFMLVVSICLGICGVILEFIPILGAIAYFALALFASAFEYVAVMRIAVADRLGAGFDLAQVWQTCKRNFSALCCATIVPMLIIGAVTMVIAFALSLIIGLPLLGGLFEYANSITSSYYSDAQAFNLIMGVLAIMLPLFLVVYIVASFISAFQQVLIMRATGHYVARYAQDWKSEQAVMSTAHINDN